MHAARLAEAIQRKIPDVLLAGMGGREMRKAGVNILYDAAKIAVVGLVEVLWHIGDILAAMRTLKNRLKNSRVDLLILLDLPDFNLKLAAFAKKLGIPVLYYISPQVWAWRTGRVRKIANLVDRMAVILPFEKKFYENFGVQVDFVGHPLADVLGGQPEQKPALQHKSGAGSYTVGLMPGSRQKEIERLLPLFFETAILLLAREKSLNFLVFLAPGMEDSTAYDICPDELKSRVQFINRDRYLHMQRCHAVMVASGTATLELALLDVPMVVTYRISALTYFFAKGLIKVKYVSLVNLIVDRPIVPELLQGDATPQHISAAIWRLLYSETERSEMLFGLGEARNALGEGGAAEKTAEIAVDMIRKGRKAEKRGGAVPKKVLESR
jgi:lipid-A-disaccharide synthase